METVSVKQDVRGPVDDDVQGTAPITLALMPQQQGEVRSMADDWTGIVDRAARRRLQNRLNQRAYRKRESKKRTKKSKDKDEPLEPAWKQEPGPDVFPAVPTAHSVSSEEDAWLNQVRRSHSVSGESSSPDSTRALSKARPTPPRTTICHMNTREMMSLAEEFGNWAHQEYMMGAPDTDNLFTLTQFNVFRAFLEISNVLGFKNEWFADEEVLSPFYKRNKGSAAMVPAAKPIPATLQPTPLQRHVEHHPWIDFFPHPGIRNNVLSQGPDYDDEPLCLDIIEFAHASKSRGSGLVVWGDPCDPSSWEVSEDFARKWAWVIRGCRELFQSTNAWRARRGEPPLFSEATISAAPRVEDYYD